MKKIFVLLLILLFMCSCNKKSVDGNKTITIKFDSNPSTGYSWNYEILGEDILMITKETIPWYNATMIYPENKFRVILVNFFVRIFIYSVFTGRAFFITEAKYCPSRKQKYRANTIKISEIKKFPVLLTIDVPNDKTFELYV